MAEKWAGVTDSLQGVMKWSVAVPRWGGRHSRAAVCEGWGGALVLSTLINKQTMSAAG